MLARRQAPIRPYRNQAIQSYAQEAKKGVNGTCRQFIQV